MPHNIKTISLKRPKLTKKEREAEMPEVAEDQERYSYGTRIRFDEDEIEKIKTLKGIDAGAKVVIYGKGEVTEVRTTATADERGKKEREHVEIQITDISIEDAENAEYAFKEESEK